MPNENMHMDRESTMIRQQIGDLLEIELENKFYYVVVLSNIVLYAKKLGHIKRLNKLKELSQFWVSEYAKWHGNSENGEYWKVYDIHDFNQLIGQFSQLPEKYHNAMDYETAGVGVLIEKIQSRYVQQSISHIV